MMRWIETPVRVRFNEVDQWKIAWYGHYFAWFEKGRMDVLERFSLLPDEFVELGCTAPVVRAQCEFKKPALTNDRLVVRTRVDRTETASLRFLFEIVRDGDDSLLARGETLQVLLDHEGNMIYKFSGDIKARVESMMNFFHPPDRDA
jgi:acyl-CoA thioester hydrolase